MELVYTANAIKKLEKFYNKPISELIGLTDLDTLTSLVMAGINDTIVRAEEQITDYLDSGKDTLDLQIYIIESLENKGFLPRALKLSQKIKDKMIELGNS